VKILAFFIFFPFLPASLFPLYLGPSLCSQNFPIFCFIWILTEYKVYN